MSTLPTNTKDDRDTHFANAAKLLYDEIGKLDTRTIQTWGDYTSFDVAAKKLIAQFAYDLVEQACIDISNSQIEQGGVHIHPRAMLRAVTDLTEWPPTKDDIQ